MSEKGGQNGNGNGNGASVFHFWRDLHEGEEGDVPERMEEYHLDCRGKKRKFRLTNCGRGMASFLEAQELRQGEPGGLRLVVSYNEETQAPPYYELREKIAERLATRDLVRDPDTGRLEILNMKIHAQVGPSTDGSAGPVLFVDDQEITWEELGHILQTYEGWGLRLQVTEE